MTAPTVRTPRPASPATRARVSLLGHYSVIAQQDAEAGHSTAGKAAAGLHRPQKLCGIQKAEFSFPGPLLERTLCSPTNSARPVERVLSQSGLLMRPHRSMCLKH